MRPALAILAFALTPAAGAQTIHAEAETARLAGPNLKVARPAEGIPGPTFLTGFNDQADRAVLHVKAKAPGVYLLSLTYRTPARRGYELEINRLRIAGILAPSDVFTTQSVGKVELIAGQNEIAIDRGWGFFDLDALDLTPAPPATPPAPVTTPPVDPQITPEARALLAHIDATYGGPAPLGVYKERDADYVLATTGRLPAIMGGDLLPYSPYLFAHRTDPAPLLETERLITRAAEGYTITLSWHWGSPTGALDTKAEPWWKAFYTEATTIDLAKILADPASPDYALLLRDIDTIAVQLRKLQDAHVPVLWRPLHEAEGKWFWWGAKGPKPFIELWRLLYTRLTQVDGIHNLVWVYTSEADPAWYPGDAFVDVIGIDQYPKDLRDPESALWETLQHQFAGKKPLTISEFGGVPDIPRMQRLGEFWSYAVSWSDKEGPKKNTPEELTRIYTSPTVVTQSPSQHPPTPPPPPATPPATPPAAPSSPTSI